MESDKEKIETFLHRESIDLIVVNSWSILPSSTLAIPRYGALNIHPSRLPQYRGALPTLWSLKNNDSESAVTFLVLTGAMDEGDILSQYPFYIHEEDSSLDLEKKIAGIVQKRLNADIGNLTRGARLSKQLGTPSSTGRYEPYRQIRWTVETMREVFNKVLLYPYIEPGLFCFTRLRTATVPVRNLCIRGRGELSPGEYCLRGFILHIGACDGSLSTRLFSDIPFLESLSFIKKPRGSFID